MSDTSPNAFHVEAEAKRQLAAQYASEANELEAQARALEDEQANDDTVSPEVPAQEEQAASADTSGDRKRTILGKK